MQTLKKLNRQKIFISKIQLFTVAIIGVLILVYLTSCFQASKNRKYSYTQFQPFCLTLTWLLQPTMNAFFHGKITHACHYKTTTKPELTVQPLLVNNLRRRGDLGNIFQVLKTILAETDGNLEGWIIQPKNYPGFWKLGFCSEEFCQVSTIQYQNEVKILADGSGLLWGVDEDGNQIGLELIRKGRVSENKSTLYI